MFKKNQPPVMRTTLWLAMELQHRNLIQTPPTVQEKALLTKMMQGKSERPEHELLKSIVKLTAELSPA